MVQVNQDTQPLKKLFIMTTAHLFEESKKYVCKKMRDLQDAEDCIFKIIINICKESRDSAKELLQIQSKSKFLKKVQHTHNSIDKALYQLFKIKVLITTDDDESSSEESDYTSIDKISKNKSVELGTSIDESSKKSTDPQNSKDSIFHSKSHEIINPQIDLDFSKKSDSGITSSSHSNHTDSLQLFDRDSYRCNLTSLSSNEDVNLIDTNTPECVSPKISNQNVINNVEQNCGNANVFKNSDEHLDKQENIESCSYANGSNLFSTKIQVINDSSRTIKEIKLEPGTNLQNIYITEVKTPSLFWIQIESQEFEILENKLQHYGKLSKQVIKHPPAPETFCCVRSNIDNCWYRYDFMQDFVVDVFYVDNGKTENSVASLHIRVLPELFYALDGQAIPCKLSQKHSENILFNDCHCHISSMVVAVLFITQFKNYPEILNLCFMERWLSMMQTFQMHVIFHMIMLFKVTDVKAVIYPKAGSWTNEDIKLFKQLIIPSELKAVVVSPLSLTEPYSIKLLHVKSSIDITQEFLKCSSSMLLNADCIKTDQIPSLIGKNSVPAISCDISSEKYLAHSNIPYPVTDKCTTLHVMTSYVKSLSEIYFHKINEITIQLDQFEDELNLWCENLCYQVKANQIQINSCWFVFCSVNKRWYRGRILKQFDNQEYLVFLVDYGNKVKVQLNDLKPLSNAFAKIPAFAILGSLYGIITDHNEDIKDRLTELICLDIPLCADIMSSVADDLVGLNLGILLWNEESEERICLNSVLLKDGIVKSDDIDIQQFITASTNEETTEVSETTDNLNIWNPMNEDFESDMNTYEMDKDDPGVALMGFKARDVAVCRNYNRGKCYRGDSCPFKHITYDDAITSAETFTTIVDGKKLDLPMVGTMVAINISCCQTPCHFYAIFPYGCKSVKELKEKDTKCMDAVEQQFDEIITFNEELTKFYDKMKFHGNRGILPSIGSLIVVKSTLDLEWRRAKVLEVDAENGEIDVFYVDIGNYDTISFKNYHEIDSRFIHLPYQAVECFVPDIVPIGNVWSEESFDVSNVLYVTLFDTSENKDINIGHELIRLNFAKESPTSNQKCSNKSSLPSYNRFVPG
ncbi:Tudor and KH domain-containing protein [Nymphon striatum]|nr:Tudor and KH domain-containing protein [Nymphon striatum]